MKFTLEIDIPDSVNELDDEEAIREILKGLGTARSWRVSKMKVGGPFHTLYRVKGCPEVDVTLTVS